MYDVYLGGVSRPEWRTEFKSQISTDISVFDPYLEKFQSDNDDIMAEQIARELFFIEQCNIAVFYLSSSFASKSARLQIGDAVGNGKQVIVCLDGNVPGMEYVKKYCEYRGIILTNSLPDLIMTVEEYVAELDLCEN